jgi:hypothetical protein
MLYRQYFEKNNNLIHLPAELTATPNNPLLKEVEASFNFTNPLDFNSEYSRDLYLESLDLFKIILGSSFIPKTNLPINLSFISDFFLYYLFGFKQLNQEKSLLEGYKNPYRPLRKGISSMLRLHSSGVVAMPIEVRLQILASSKDVIHS